MVITTSFSQTLEEQRAKRASALSSIGLSDGCTVGGGVNGTVLGVMDLGRRHGLDCRSDRRQSPAVKARAFIYAGGTLIFYDRDLNNPAAAIGSRNRDVQKQLLFRISPYSCCLSLLQRS